MYRPSGSRHFLFDSRSISPFIIVLWRTHNEKETSRQLGVSEQYFYRWKRMYQGIGIAELRRLGAGEPVKRAAAEAGYQSPSAFIAASFAAKRAANDEAAVRRRRQ